MLTIDRARQRALWPAIGNPGAVLAGGALVGLFRARLSGSTLTVTITPWQPIDAGTRAELEREALLVGTVRGAARTRLVVD